MWWRTPSTMLVQDHILEDNCQGGDLIGIIPLYQNFSERICGCAFLKRTINALVQWVVFHHHLLHQANWTDFCAGDVDCQWLHQCHLLCWSARCWLLIRTGAHILPCCLNTFYITISNAAIALWHGSPILFSHSVLPNYKLQPLNLS